MFSECYLRCRTYGLVLFFLNVERFVYIYFVTDITWNFVYNMGFFDHGILAFNLPKLDFSKLLPLWQMDMSCSSIFFSNLF